MSRKQRDFIELDQVMAIERIADCVCEIRHDITRIANAVEKLVPSEVTDFVLYQLSPTGEKQMINGTVVGTTSTFQIGFVPATNFVPLTTGPTVSVDDTLVTLSPVSTDGNFTFTAAVAASDTGASYNLTILGVNGAGAAVTHTFNVPILPTPPPPATQITDFSLNQLS